ncbi:hypothetical protein JX266_006135 [Neoarthrinium moseri]|nr:hypothetical protein JX266_006135 [Neoarthrinium moseri]
MALEFYRVHVPGVFSKEFLTPDDSEPIPRTLYFNPEYDFLEVHTKHTITPVHVDFIYKLKTIYDPKHVGLLRLAVDHADVEYLSTSLDREGSDLDIKRELAASFSGLKEVMLVFTSSNNLGRQVDGDATVGPDIFNRSNPLLATTTTFKRLNRDPRCISRDLKRTLLWTVEPQRTVRLWKTILAQAGLSFN